MPTEIASTKYGVLIHHDQWNTLELKWLPTKDATEAQARDTMALFAAETEKRKPRFLIVDTTEFFHRWADDMMAWRDKEIIPTTTPGVPRSSPSSPAKMSRSRPSSPAPNRRLKAPRPSPPGGSPAGTGPTNGWPNNRQPGPGDRRDLPPKRHSTPAPARGRCAIATVHHHVRSARDQERRQRCPSPTSTFRQA
jgi:hypothetical protein